MNHSIRRKVIALVPLLLAFVHGTQARAFSPNCSIEADFGPRDHAPITIEMEVVCGSRTIESMNWSLGDGTFLTGNPITHTYLEDGSYSVVASGIENLVPLTRRIHLPTFVILDDFEDFTSSLLYWQISNSVAESLFAAHFAERSEDGVANTELRTSLFGDGNPDGGGNYGGNGINLPPIPASGGGSPFQWSPELWPAGSPEGRVEFDLRYDMTWGRGGASAHPFRFDVMSLVGPQARLVGRKDSLSLSLRLEVEGGQVSPWVYLQPGDGDTRVSLIVSRPNQFMQPILQLIWSLSDGTQTVSTQLDLALGGELVGMVATDQVVQMESGPLPGIMFVGKLYYDNVEFAHHLD